MPRILAPFPIRSTTAGTSLPDWLIQVRDERAKAIRVRLTARAYFEASGGRSAAPAAKRGRTVRPLEVSTMPELALDKINAALQEAVLSNFSASRSEAAFCQAGVVAPPDSLTGETRCDGGEGF